MKLKTYNFQVTTPNNKNAKCDAESELTVSDKTELESQN